MIKSKSRASGIDRLLGERLRERRVQIGMSQEQVGKHLGISFQQVQKYEKGINRISVARLVELIKILKTTPQFFIGDLVVVGKIVPEPKGLVDSMAMRDHVAMDKALTHLAPEVRRSMVDLAKTLASA